MDNRDSIDFAKTSVGKLFRQMFVPTLISMISMVVLNVTDGAFVGHGCGSNALAAVNIVAPLFLISSGLGLMFGIGGSIVASIHLAKDKVKAASINVTQSLLGALLTGVTISTLILLFQRPTCILFGCSDELMDLACSYMRWIAAFMPLSMVSMVTMFVIRLDGSPRFAMGVHLFSALLNMLLDYVFIFPFGWGLEGAAMATSLSFALGGLIGVGYLFVGLHTLSLRRLRFTQKSLMLTLRNLSYQVKLGASAMLGEVAIAGVIIIGNYVFIRYLGEDGVAAYSVGCYCLPIVFMLGNAIVQSAQPIISFGHGAGDVNRVNHACRIAFNTAFFCGLIGMLFLWGGSGLISSIFLDSSCRAYELCCEGLPYFSACSVFVALNIVAVGYYQSVERPLRATLYTLLRGIVLVVPCFVFMPHLFGTPGIWLALPMAEVLTFTVILLFARFSKAKKQ